MCALSQNIVLLTQSEQILKASFKGYFERHDIQIPVFDNSSRKYNNDFANTESSFIISNITQCVPRVFLLIKIEINYTIKEFLSIVLNTHGAKYLGDMISRQNIVSTNLTLIVVHKYTSKYLFISNFCFDKIRKMVKHQQITIILVSTVKFSY